MTQLYSAEISATSQIIRSYPLPAESGYVKSELNIISKDLDLFNIRGDKVGSASEHGSIGDLNGLNLQAGIGLYEHISVIYDAQFLRVDYAGESLKNNKHELFTKLNIYQNPHAMFDTISSDIGLIHNSADDLSITGSSLGISKMDDMSDSSLYVRLLAGSKIRSSILDFYLGFKYTTIDGRIDTTTYDRNEVALNTGLQYTLELGSFLIEAGYEYLRLFSRDIDSGENSNHILNLTFSKAINTKLLLYLGSKLYLHQYNGVIPYLYNEKTKDRFDQKFGYATIGFVYNFDLSFSNR